MIAPRRQVNLDVSGRIDVTDPDSVAREIGVLLANAYPGEDTSLVARMVADFASPG